MKSIKYIAAVALLGASLTACTNNSRDSATTGGSQDTSNVETGNSAGSSSMTSDTSKNGNPLRNDSTTDNGNVDPSGHVGKDSTNSNKNSRPSHT